MRVCLSVLALAISAASAVYAQETPAQQDPIYLLCSATRSYWRYEGNTYAPGYVGTNMKQSLTRTFKLHNGRVSRWSEDQGVWIGSTSYSTTQRHYTFTYATTAEWWINYAPEIPLDFETRIDRSNAAFRMLARTGDRDLLEMTGSCSPTPNPEAGVPAPRF